MLRNITNKTELDDFNNLAYKALLQGEVIEVAYKFVDKRSIQQNRYYFKVIVGGLVTFYKANLVALFKDVIELLGVNLTPDFIHQLLKMAFNNGASTTKKDKVDFMEGYIHRIRHWYFHKHGLDLPEPPLNELTHKE